LSFALLSTTVYYCSLLLHRYTAYYCYAVLYKQKAGGTAMSFAYFKLDPVTGTPVDCSILVSKSAGRYRIQSSQLAALWLIADQLVQRLGVHWGDSPLSPGGSNGSSGGSFTVSYSEPLPLHDVFAAVDEHFRCVPTAAQRLQ
jgi:PTHB1 C-terminus